MKKLIIFGYIAAAILAVAGWSSAFYWKFEAQDTRIRTLRAEVKRMNCRQNNFVTALDNTYNLLQEHMRGVEEGKQKNIPWKPAPDWENCDK